MIHDTSAEKMTGGVLVAFFLLVSGSEAKNDVRRVPVRSENIVLGNPTDITSINTRGIGYYYASYYAGAGCVGKPTYQEGYATGKCLTLGTPPGVTSPQQLSTNPLKTSIRMDCSATCK